MKTVRTGARGTKTHIATKQRRIEWPRYFWAWMLVLLILVGAAVVHVNSKLTAVELGYALSAAASEHQQLLVEQHKLQVEVATLRSPQRLRKVAIEKLGLVEPTAIQLLRPKQNPTNRAALSHVTGR